MPAAISGRGSHTRPDAPPHLPRHRPHDTVRGIARQFRLDAGNHGHLRCLRRPATRRCASEPSTAMCSSSTWSDAPRRSCTGRRSPTPRSSTADSPVASSDGPLDSSLAKVCRDTPFRRCSERAPFAAWRRRMRPRRRVSSRQENCRRGGQFGNVGPPPLALNRSDRARHRSRAR